jgi:hypothetical protein
MSVKKSLPKELAPAASKAKPSAVKVPRPVATAEATRVSPPSAKPARARPVAVKVGPLVASKPGPVKVAKRKLVRRVSVVRVRPAPAAAVPKSLRQPALTIPSAPKPKPKAVAKARPVLPAKAPAPQATSLPAPGSTPEPVPALNQTKPSYATQPKPPTVEKIKRTPAVPKAPAFAAAAPKPQPTPAKPVRPETSKAAVKTVQPEAPKAAAKPVQPEAPKAAVKPVQPEAPKAAVKPVQPEAPKATVKPVQPETSKATVKPVQPEAPKAAVKPVPKPAADTPTIYKKRTKSVANPPIPAILLEGDYPPPQAVSGPGQRYSIGPGVAEPPYSSEEPGDLPEAYGTQRLLLTARDPQWVYAHWDLTREQQRQYNQLSAEGHLTLKVYENEVGGRVAAEAQVHPESRHWFVHVGKGGTKYVAELGYDTLGGQWITVSTSGGTLTPPDSLSEDTSVQFATLPTSLPLPKLAALVKELALEHVSLVEAIQELRAQGHVALPVRAAFDTHVWTPEQERALAEVISMDEVRRVWIGSLEITELIRRKIVGELASQAAADITSPLGAFGSISSPFGGGQRPAGFWFNVNAELIIYGATEADASVTIGGRQIKLRPDGSFSYRFALPDGQYPLPAVATSADGAYKRWADLHFSRATQYGGAVGAHPQDARLKPPLATHL